VQSFGERLRKEREKQGVTLDEVCVSTKIAVRFLRAIEDERFEQLPGGIFNKGFVRAYAQHLAINEDEAVADYLQAAGLLPNVPLNTTPPGEEKAPESKAPEIKAVPIKTPEIKIKIKKLEVKPAEVKPAEVKPAEIRKPAAKAPVETRAALVETRPAKNKGKAAKPQPKQEKNKQAQPVRQPSPEPEADNEHWFPWGKVAFALLLIAFGFAMWGSFHSESEEHTGRPVAQPAVNQSLTTPEPRALQNVSADPPAAAGPAPTTQTETSPVATSPETQEAAASAQLGTVPNGSFVVVVQAHEDSWVSIVVDGKEVMKDVMAPSAEKAIEAHKEVVIKAGNVGALDFVFNGKKLPPQGNYDEVKTLTFDPNGLQSQPVKTAGL
jgi:transcriptional regulator with XRE-family HTH domain